ncbi:pectinesterase family protein [Clostridium sp. SHJSY1]|uniref:pectinesterase family protein n=1 Tax=Clostridium sp. SHJSY1 TaxID=2942483 RepID=UPI0028752CE4|nr:pectinesterase family protein [Clostridium sp. SHJSY1]MDS0526009.1 pectinesterase family protein [Clostridium sp. SHJSY1]
MKLRKRLGFMMICSLVMCGSVGSIANAKTLLNKKIVVSKDGKGDYTTVQEAINAVPDNNASWYTINIKDGVYKEVITVPSSKKFVHLVGESAEGTVLTYDNCNSISGSTEACASTFLEGDDFYAENITFENSFDYNNSTLPNKQAVACEPMGDRQVFRNCRFTGYQDTLYVRKGRQYFQDCYISGHTDFIFGASTAVFKNCEVYSKYKVGASVTAPSTLTETQYGLVFLDSKFIGDSSLPTNSIYLGRPWHPSYVKEPVWSSATFIRCNLGQHINSNGWTKMKNVEPSTERLREYKNYGPGAVINEFRPQLAKSDAKEYKIKKLLKGNDSWNPEKVISSVR